MISTRKSTIKKIVIYLSFLFVILFSSYFLFLQDKKTPDFEFYTARFQETLNSKEIELKQQLKKIVAENQSSNPFDGGSFFSSYSRLYKENGFGFFVFKNDSIVGWSTNLIGFDESLLDSAHTNRLLHLKNGWFEVLCDSSANTHVLGLILLKNDYKYQNDYLNNDFQKDFNLPSNTLISEKQSEHFITNCNGKKLGSLSFSDTNKNQNDHSTVVFLLFVIGFFLFIQFLFFLFDELLNKLRKHWVTIFAISSVILLRVCSFYFTLPPYVYSLEIFTPKYYAASYFLPSLGDLLLNCVFVFSIGVYFHKRTQFEEKLKINSKISRILISFLLVFCSAAAFSFTIDLLKNVILNSTLILNLSNIFALSFYSFIGFFIIALILFSFFLFTSRFLQIALKLSNSPYSFVAICTITLLGFGIFHSYYSIEKVYLLLLFFAYSLGIIYYYNKHFVLLTPSSLVYFIIIFSLIATYSLYHNNDFKEKEKRKLTAIKLSSERDPIAEFLFADQEIRVQNDDTIKKYIHYLPESEPLIAKRLQHFYFNGYWLKYDMQTTICQPNDSLLINPDNYKTECNEFFNKIVNNIGVPTLSSNFYYLNKETGRNSYLAIFNYPTDTLASIKNKPTSIHIELDSKFIPKELGYPELLIDKELNINKDMSGYSYAKYKNGVLNTQYGKYFYFLDTKFYKQFKDEFTFFTSDGYSHLLYKSDPTTAIIISKKQDNILDIIAPFSYLFTFLLVLVLIFLFIFNYPINSKKIYLSFKGRLQIAMISIVLFSFIFIGTTTVYYIIGIYENKNVDNISEKAHSILVEMENKLSGKENLTPESADFISDLLIKFSNIYFTDINLFDQTGKLISSSRNKIFDEGMLSKRMDPNAYYNLSIANRTLFIHNESIGKLKYTSVYLPFRNNQNEVIAYLNIPYFAKQSELKKEISTFLVAFINVYVLLVAIAIIFALLISSYIARPLKLIRNKLSQIKLGKRNEKIEWSKEDELGLLITEYNRMIDELAKSAELLARSERESAWREMAKQVAHEIKNPLTPMKLSVQYLQKAWKENNTDWDERLDRFTHTMIEQIETLSLIASEFSNFANIAKVRNEKIDLIKLIEGAITLFKDFNIQISFEKQKGEKLFINADKTQMLRVFNNLIKNSIQAIDSKPDGKINLSVQQKESFYLISITDNGCGIPDDRIEKIFTPNFTTKTGGMGLGLVMVKGIIDTAGGEIWFETQEGIGTTFFFTIPQISNN